jgi:MarR family transcriptional regulator, organic hydroperoxide resistance regulator
MYKLTDSLPYLLNTIGVCLGEAFSAELSDHQLTLPMFRVLAALLQREEQRLGELSQMVRIEGSTLSRLVGTMKSRRLVSRRRQRGDERSVQISLTAEGRVLAERLVPRAVYYENLAVRNFDDASIDNLKETLRKMQDNVAGLMGSAARRPILDMTTKPSPRRKSAAKT